MRTLYLMFFCLLYVLTFPMKAQSQPVQGKPQVTVVLAGGGAKGFAHLAVLRRLEKDQVPIAKIIGTSMGAVIGGLYATGMSTNDIERILGNIDPSEVALDLVDRLELSNRARAYQQQYPIDFNFGINIYNGEIMIARGLSDGQRFLALLQKLTSHIPSQVDFDQLKIPFRAVATRSDTGEIQVFKNGSLPLAIRASMAAPGVFAPIEINGETYLDGGLVSNLPVEVAIDEGADIIVASFLKSTDQTIHKRQTDNALTLADRMLDILIKQNERRNLKLLRPQDLLVSTQLPDIEFTDFGKYVDIIEAGEKSILDVDYKFINLAKIASVTINPPQKNQRAQEPQKIKISTIEVVGTKEVSSKSISGKFSSLINKEYDPSIINQLIEDLYLTGDFEKIYYSLNELSDDNYKLLIEVNEKNYGPNYYKTSISLLSEQDGVNLFSIGVGYRRPWLNGSGLEARIDGRIGTDRELSGQLIQPIDYNVTMFGVLGHRRIIRPYYPPRRYGDKKLIDVSIETNYYGFGFQYDAFKIINAQWSLTGNQLRLNPANINYRNFDTNYLASRLDLTLDNLDSTTFSTEGYYARFLSEKGLSGSTYRSSRLNLKWASSIKPYIFTLGFNAGHDEISNNCINCINPNLLYLGGFQSMGAFKFGQLTGDNLRHFQATLSYQLSDGGLFRQKTYVGFVTEIGDAWSAPESFSAKRSQTAFIGVDSKIGDIYLGVAKGSEQAKNIFIQLGRHFGY